MNQPIMGRVMTKSHQHIQTAMKIMGLNKIAFGGRIAGEEKGPRV